MLNVLGLRKKKRYSQFELAFLMGQRDFYVRDAEDPMDKLMYGGHFANIFRQIFDCPLQDIIPNLNVEPSYSISISQSTDESGNITYRAERQFADGRVEFITELGTEDKDLQLEFEEGTNAASAQTVRDWVASKIESDYFDTSKNALQIFNDCKYDLDCTVRPLFLYNALKSFNGTKGLPKIDRKKDTNARFVYKKND